MQNYLKKKILKNENMRKKQQISVFLNVLKKLNVFKTLSPK
jgi:hypothetical protein